MEAYCQHLVHYLNKAKIAYNNRDGKRFLKKTCNKLSKVLNMV